MKKIGNRSVNVGAGRRGENEMKKEERSIVQREMDEEVKRMEKEFERMERGRIENVQ